jgi:predicted aspartyl protease
MTENRYGAVASFWRNVGRVALALLLFLRFCAVARADCRIERQAILPMTFNGFMPMIGATINGRPVSIGIDTGSQGTVVTPETVDHLNLSRDPNRFTTAGGAGRAWVNNALLDTLEFGGAVYARMSVAVIALGQPSTATDRPLAGLIGADLLSRYDLDFDGPGHRVILYRIRDCAKLVPPWEESSVAVPVSVTGSRRPVIPIELDGYRLKAIFDTGASGMLLARSSGVRVGVSAEMLAQDPAGNIFDGGRDDKIPLHRFDRVRVGDETFRGRRIGMLDFPTNEADMLIGGDYVRDRRFWLSYATRTLFIRSEAARGPGR